MRQESEYAWLAAIILPVAMDRCPLNAIKAQAAVLIMAMGMIAIKTFVYHHHIRAAAGGFNLAII